MLTLHRRHVRWTRAVRFAALMATLGASAGPAAGVAAAQPARLVAGAGVTAGVAAGAATDAPAAAVPFGPGERAEYRVHLGGLAVGRGSIAVTRVDTVRGRPAYHTAFQVRGGVPFYRVDDRFESWIDVRTLASLRHVQATKEGRRRRERRYEIYPDRGVYTEAAPAAGRSAGAADNSLAPAEHRSVERPFDEGSFVQFVRTVPLEVGRRYVFDRYYKPDRNPVTLEVLRRERVTVPAGTFDALVVRPSFRTKGIFAQSGGTEVWLSDDARRVVLRMQTRLPFGTITLALTDYTAPADTRPNGGAATVTAAPATAGESR